MKYFLFYSLIGIFISCQQPKSGPESTSAKTSVNDQASTSEQINPNIDVAKAKEIIANYPDIVLIDVRTPEEVVSGKIGNALEMDITAPDFKNQLNTLDKSKDYIVYCAAGGRSARAVTMMNEMGFTKTYNLQSGYNGWIKQQ